MKNNKAIEVGTGIICRKCNVATVTKKHPPHWQNRKSYYFTQWDYCKKCCSVYFDEKYKSSAWVEAEDTEARFNNSLFKD